MPCKRDQVCAFSLFHPKWIFTTFLQCWKSWCQQLEDRLQVVSMNQLKLKKGVHAFLGAVHYHHQLQYLDGRVWQFLLKMLHLQRYLLRMECFISFIPKTGSSSFYRQICCLMFCFKSKCWCLLDLEIFDNNMKDGIDAFDIYEVAMLLFVVDSHCAIIIIVTFSMCKVFLSFGNLAWMCFPGWKWLALADPMALMLPQWVFLTMANFVIYAIFPFWYKLNGFLL